MIAGHGIDIIEVGRIKEAAARFGRRFIERIFDRREIAEAEKRREPYQFYASRFAAKEAFSKALGTGFTGFWFRDVVVVRDRGKPPRFEFSKKLLERFPDIRTENFVLSISHLHDTAIASVIREKGA